MNSENHVYQVIGELTGMDTKGLHREMNLESDLGLDSIKMMGLLNHLITSLPPQRSAELNLQIDAQTLVGMHTLGDLIRFLEGGEVPAVPTAAIPAAPASTPDPILGAEKPVHRQVEILDSQALFLVSGQLVDSISICASLKLRGPFQVDAANLAWKDLIDRQVNLKAYFTVSGGTSTVKDYRCFLHESGREGAAPAMEVKDLRHLSPVDRESAVQEEFDRWLNFSWKIDQWPLHRFSALRLEDDLHQLFLGNEHIISDGLGNHVILREFLELYRARVTGRVPNLPPALPPDAYDAMVRNMNAHRSVEETKALEEHNLRQGKKPFFWNPMGAKISSPMPMFRNQTLRIDRAATAGLAGITRAWRIPMNSILIAAYLRTIARFGGFTGSILLQVPTSGRVYPESDATGLVGCFAQNLSLAFAPPSPAEDWRTLLERVHGEVQAALVSGIDKAQSWEVAGAIKKEIVLQDGKIPDFMRSLMRSGMKSNLYFPFTGHTHLQPDYGNLRVEDYRAGTINNPGTLDILQEIFDDQLFVFANYDANFFPQSLIGQVMEDYFGRLKELAVLGSGNIVDAHVTQEPASSFTSSSVPAEEPVLEGVRMIAGDVRGIPLNAADLDRDLEGDLGMDSLERIRIITRISATYKGRVDRNALFSCRSLREMARFVSAPKEEVPSAVPSVRSFDAIVPGAFDGSLPAIPYLHIARQASLTPELAAVRGTDGKSITYRELETQSNQLAHYLRSQGAGPGKLVGLMALRGPHMLIGILGILKSGAAYLPVDPEYPAERIGYILGHAGAEILFSESAVASRLTECLGGQSALKTLLFLDAWTPMLPAELQEGRTLLSRRVWSRQPVTAPEFSGSPDDLMVVLYTSGSTGKPKGVALNHRGYMNRLAWHQKCFMLQAGERVAQKTSCCFDISVWELLWPLMVGGTVCAVEKDVVRNPWKLAEWMKAVRVNIMHFVPSMFGEFVHSLAGESWAFPDLRWLVFSGEALPVPIMREWIDAQGLRTGLANLYGPTEASIDVTFHIIDKRPGEDVERIPIGKPIDNVHILILDPDRRPLPAGQVGELCIGGIQVATGYLNDPGRTSEAFVKNGFPGIPGPCIYRTGDLAVELPDGSFDYRGRMDNQVKIRGFRVELGEVESALNAIPGVRESAVMAVDFGDQKKLVAWLAGGETDPMKVKEALGRRLADYMVPHHILWLANLPKTQNGKLDRKALLASFRPGEQAVPIALEPEDENILPLGPAQRWLVSYFQPPYQWWGYTRFLFKQPLDLDAFVEAYMRMVRKHPGMRTTFVEQVGVWKQKVMSGLEKELDMAIETYDATHLSALQRDAEMRRIIQAMSEDLRIDGFPLGKVVVLKHSETCYEIAMVGHHMVGDLVSNNIIFKQLWLAYDQVLSGEEEKRIPVSASTYPEYVRFLRDEERNNGFDDHVGYWKERFPSRESAFPFPPDHVKGENVESSAAQEKFQVPEKESQILLRDARSHFESSLYPLLLAPLYRMLAEWTGRPSVVLSHRMSGRDPGVPGRNFFDGVGNFAINFPVSLRVEPADSWERSLAKIKEAFSELPMNGATYDWVSGRLPEFMYPDDKLTPIRVNYLGNLGFPPSALFEIKQEERDQRLSPPGQKRTIPIEIHFYMLDGLLRMDITYSKNLYRQATIRDLGARYLESLGKMMAQITVKPGLTADAVLAGT